MVFDEALSSANICFDSENSIYYVNLKSPLSWTKCRDAIFQEIFEICPAQKNKKAHSFF